MSAFEQRKFFEELCQLRALYRLRGHWDATSAISIVDAIAHAAYLLDAPEALAAALGIDAAADSTPTGPGSKR